jgi:hypothetical protein
MKSKLYIALLWVLVFLLGGVAGAVSYHLYRLYNPPTREYFLNKLRNDLKKDLNLDDRQTNSIMAIFEERFQRKQALYKEIQPQLDAVRNEYNEKIRHILSPDQQKLFEKRLKKFSKPETQPPPPPPPSQEK